MNLKRYLAPNAREALARSARNWGRTPWWSLHAQFRGGGIHGGRYQDLTRKPTCSPAQRQSTAGLMAELKGIKHLIKSQLASLSWSLDKRRHPRRVEMVQMLLNAGFSPMLTRSLAARLPRGLDSQGMNRWLRAVLIRNLAAWSKLDRLWQQRGIWALVGPTGAGKTTTLAKLASRAVDALGAHQIALVTLDAYRIGAYEQTQTYADLLGVELVQDRRRRRLLSGHERDRTQEVGAAGYTGPKPPG